MNNHLEKFINYISNTKKLSKNTIDSYSRDLRNYFSYIESKDIVDSLSVNDTDIMMYNMHLKNNNKSASTISRSLATLRNYYGYLHNAGLISSNPTLNINSPKAEKKMPDILSIKEIENLLKQPDITTAIGSRDNAMLEILYASGIKVTELISLNVCDVNFEYGFIRCQSSKSSDRIIPIGKIAQSALSNYIEDMRSSLTNELAGPLFVNYTGQRLSRQGFWKLLKAHTKAANIEKSITPHTLRHSFAVHLIQNGADLSVVKELLGHSDISSTQVYLELSKYSLKEIYDKAHPRA
ncbi:MAG: site-specific tyrosine recombinase XerD [Acidaminobacteraceae bacterium]